MTSKEWVEIINVLGAMINQRRTYIWRIVVGIGTGIIIKYHNILYTSIKKNSKKKLSSNS